MFFEGKTKKIERLSENIRRLQKVLCRVSEGDVPFAWRGRATISELENKLREKITKLEKKLKKLTV